jgi:D-glycero-D-manno-heptose 1,7-bisphosphate phosphatase
MIAMRPAVFLEKDGTLLEKAPAGGGRIRLRPGAVDALLLLSGLGYELVVIGNQPGVARGVFPIGALEAVSAHLDDLFLTHGFKLAGSYWCPHDPAGRVMEYSFECACRMPQAGLLHAAAGNHGLDLARSWVIGSDADTIEAGQRAGCSTAWIADASVDCAEPAFADIPARDLLDAATRIMHAREGRAGAESRPVLDAY